MPDHPFHVAGGFFAPTSHHQPEPLALQSPGLREEASSASPQGSRRRKLWEIPHKFHCPLIGVCFGVDELRGLMAKAIDFPRETTDFVLHTTAVGACESRSRLADLLHKQLEKRFHLSIRAFSRAKEATSLQQLWRESADTGSDVPGALWACWTHPACAPLLEQDIYGGIHMLQHQIGSATRADLATLRALTAENVQLHRWRDEAYHEIEKQRAERARETQRLGQRVTELRVELAGKDAYAANLAGQLDALRQSLPELRDRQGLARRAADAEARACALTAQAGELGRELEHLRGLTKQADETIQFLLADGNQPGAEPEARADAVSAHLSGKCILCVGGRSGSIDAYRQIVEQRGGRFLHHDGGLEESLHRIDGFLAAADLVICQAGGISHNAYWRVKEQCKRTGKPCLYMKNSGASSLSRLIDRNQNDPLPTSLTT